MKPPPPQDSAATGDAASSDAATSTPASAMRAPADRAVDVLAVGAQCLVQDAGRPGFGHVGVPRSGWLDAPCAELANRLVGNPAQAPVLECLLGGLELYVRAAVTFAVTGAHTTVWVERGHSKRAGPPELGGTQRPVRGRAVPFGEPVAVGPGSIVRIGTPEPRAGLRTYVAVSGGFEAEAVLGSSATCTLSGLGPAPVVPGTSLRVGPPFSQPGAASGFDAMAVRKSEEVWVAHVGESDVRGVRCAVLQVARGPRQAPFAETAWSRFIGGRYTVQPDSDRIALRLAGPPLARRPRGDDPGSEAAGWRAAGSEIPGEEMPSEPLVLGAVQVPPDGQPLIFLADHPTTGGYPVLAVVLNPWLCAQLRPGAAVAFTEAHY